MEEIVKVKKGVSILEVPKRVYEVVYAHHGFEIVKPAAPKKKGADRNDTWWIENQNEDTAG